MDMKRKNKKMRNDLKVFGPIIVIVLALIIVFGTLGMGGMFSRMGGGQQIEVGYITTTIKASNDYPGYDCVLEIKKTFPFKNKNERILNCENLYPIYQRGYDHPRFPGEETTVNYFYDGDGTASSSNNFLGLVTSDNHFVQNLEFNQFGVPIKAHGSVEWVKGDVVEYFTGVQMEEVTGTDYYEFKYYKADTLAELETKMNALDFEAIDYYEKADIENIKNPDAVVVLPTTDITITETLNKDADVIERTIEDNSYIKPIKRVMMKTLNSGGTVSRRDFETWIDGNLESSYYIAYEYSPDGEVEVMDYDGSIFNFDINDGSCDMYNLIKVTRDGVDISEFVTYELFTKVGSNAFNSFLFYY